METTIRTVVPGNKQQQQQQQQQQQDQDQDQEPSTSFGTQPSGVDADAGGDENQADARNGSKAGNGASEPNEGEKLPKEKDAAKSKDALVIEDLTLPKSIMNRLAKTDLPTGTQIQANAMAAITRSTTVFISYLASAANDNAREAGKKTILPADVFKALEDTEFGFLRQQLELEFAKYTELQTAKRSKKKPAGVKKDDSDASPEDAARAAEPRTKKAKIDEFAMDVDDDDDEADVPVEDVDAEDVHGDEEEDDEAPEEEEEAAEDEEDDEEEADDDADDNMAVEEDGFDDADVEEERMQRELLEQDDAVDDGEESD